MKKKVVSPEAVIEKLKPGMSIFIGTGAAEPRTLVKHLMTADKKNLEDLELVQLVSFGDAISLKELRLQKYRLKTFFSGWVSREAITAGQVDLIPSRFAWIPRLIESGQVRINVAFVQITPPDTIGNCSLGIAVDVARQAMEKASLVVGEINHSIPMTFGDTFVHFSDFDMLVVSDELPFYFDRWPVDDAYDVVARNVASLVSDGSCIAFSIGPLYEALGRHLMDKQHLGIHSPFITDALMDLIKNGSVSNRYKETYRGKSLVSYALGTSDLMQWLNQNPLIEFQGIDKVFDPVQIGRNPKFIAVLPARKIDLSGRIALQIGKGNVGTGPAEVQDFFRGAEISNQGRTIFALPSRNTIGAPNIRLSVKDFPNQFGDRESIDTVVTEFGIANLKGSTLRERAQALIELAHPDDREALIHQAKQAKIIYPDQIYLSNTAHLYPAEIACTHTFKGGMTIRFRATKPSDEEGMRRLFYRFSDESVYARYLGHVKAMPHEKTQAYVNVDWTQAVSVVGIVENAGKDHVVAEARFIRETGRPYAEVVFVVDEAYQGIGIAGYLLNLLASLAKERELQKFTADVLFSNIAMMKVFKKSKFPMQIQLESGIYHLELDIGSAT
jgi:acyl-CoA hydrolase/GNAT superfamily N-acetyltransferase